MSQTEVDRNQVSKRFATSQQLARGERLEARSIPLAWTGFVFAFLQSICAFIVAANGLRFVASFGAVVFAMATSAPVMAFHQAIYRVPMLTFSVAASCLNLAILWQARRLRARPAAQWRRQPLQAKQRRMERLQFWLSLGTLFLVGLEMLLHHHYEGAYLFGARQD